MFVRSSFRRGDPGKYSFIGLKNWKESQISWDTSKVMQSHSMTEGAENLNLNGKHLATEFSEKTISLLTTKFAIFRVLLW